MSLCLAFDLDLPPFRRLKDTKFSLHLLLLAFYNNGSFLLRNFSWSASWNIRLMVASSTTWCKVSSLSWLSGICIFIYIALYLHCYPACLHPQAPLGLEPLNSHSVMPCLSNDGFPGYTDLGLNEGAGGSAKCPRKTV